jgi:hypothetical protein
LNLPSSLASDFAAAQTFFRTTHSIATVLYAITFPLTFFIAWFGEKSWHIRTSMNFLYY